MTPPQHRALERLAAAAQTEIPLVRVGDRNTSTTIAHETASALIRRELAFAVQGGAFVAATRAGIDLAARSEPIQGTR